MQVRRKGALALLLSVALVVFVGITDRPEAKPGYEVQPRHLHLHFELPAAHGYTMSVDTRGHREVRATLSKGGVSATYKVAGHVTRRRIDADFGRLGHISGRFHGSVFHPYRDSPLRRDCYGRQPIFETGPFRGRIRFRGENGYTRVKAKRAPTVLVRTFKRICSRKLHRVPRERPGGPTTPRLFFSELSAIAHADRRTTFFGAFGIQLEGSRAVEEASEPGLAVFAATGERRHSVAIVRTAFMIGEPGAVLLTPPSERPIEATIAPPAPFDGTARFHQPAPRAERWTGTLGVHLPGGGLVPLTGPKFRAKLCRATSERKLVRCGRKIRAAREALFGHRFRRAIARLRSEVPSPGTSIPPGSPDRGSA
jgi:hypothetical protein